MGKDEKRYGRAKERICYSLEYLFQGSSRFFNEKKD
jgi:hypothetical protein